MDTTVEQVTHAVPKTAAKKQRPKRVKKPGGLRHARVGTLLMGILGLFAVVVMAVGGLSVYFFQKNFEAVTELGELTDRGNQVQRIGNDMLEARLALMVAARHWQRNEANSQAQATAALDAALARLETVRAAFAAFQGNMLQDETGRSLSMDLVRRYRSYLDDGVESMVETIRDRDFMTFDMINTQYGTPRSESFAQAVAAFGRYIDQRQSEIEAVAQRNVKVALIVVGSAVALALLLMVLARVVFGRLVLRPLVQAGTHFDRIAAGDLSHRIEVNSHNEIGVLYQALRRMQDSLGRTVSSVRQGVDEINVGASEMSAGNTDLSSRTEQQAASLQETAASMEELASTVRQNADNARQANALARGASQVAVQGGTVVADVVTTMQDISSQSRKMSDIVSVIDSIAFQTNILALNAAVEAARAGDQGKGFAVVAAEVRSLAQRSAQAAKEIKTLIDDSVSKVGVGSTQVQRAGQTMQEIVDSVQRVTDIMGEIAAASEEQSSGIEQVNRAVSQMDEVTQQNAALVEEAAAATLSLTEQASRLAQAVGVFKLGARDVIDSAAPQVGFSAPAPVRIG